MTINVSTVLRLLLVLVCGSMGPVAYGYNLKTQKVSAPFADLQKTAKKTSQNETVLVNRDQNISVIEKAQTKPIDEITSFSASAYTIYSRPVKKEKDAASFSGVELVYSLEESKSTSSSLSFAMDYTHVWANYKDETNSYIEDIELRGLTSRSSFPRGAKISTEASLGLPANQVDKNAGFRGSAGLKVTYSTEILKQKAGISLEPILYSYRFDSTNATGSEYNKKWSVELRANVTSKILEKLSWRNQLSFFQYQNTIDRNYQTYAASSTFALAWNKTLTTTLGMATRDRVISERRVLDDDTTSYRLGLELTTP
ncbi:MAG: hypothetical protein LW875_10500 [Proteobacteria bacterium]|nr:hypothetical protein [Pseudomonadota bacterium]